MAWQKKIKKQKDDIRLVANGMYPFFFSHFSLKLRTMTIQYNTNLTQRQNHVQDST